jgi:hypothetical protein
LRALKEHADAFTSSFEDDAQKPLAAVEQAIELLVVAPRHHRIPPGP